MLVFVLIVAAALLVTASWAYVRRQRAMPRRHARSGTGRMGETAATRRFASVRIRVGARACAAARGLAEETFLVGAAPELPLRSCGQAHCQCAFVKLADRRDGEKRRWADEGISATFYSAAERRAVTDRRDTD